MWLQRGALQPADARGSGCSSSGHFSCSWPGLPQTHVLWRNLRSSGRAKFQRPGAFNPLDHLAPECEAALNRCAHVALHVQLWQGPAGRGHSKHSCVSLLLLAAQKILRSNRQLPDAAVTQQLGSRRFLDSRERTKEHLGPPTIPCGRVLYVRRLKNGDAPLRYDAVWQKAEVRCSWPTHSMSSSSCHLAPGSLHVATHDMRLGLAPKPAAASQT